MSNEADISVCYIKNSCIYSLGGFVPYAAMLKGSNINALFGLLEKVCCSRGWKKSIKCLYAAQRGLKYGIKSRPEEKKRNGNIPSRETIALFYLILFVIFL